MSAKCTFTKRRRNFQCDIGGICCLQDRVHIPEEYVIGKTASTFLSRAQFWLLLMSAALSKANPLAKSHMKLLVSPEVPRHFSSLGLSSHMHLTCLKCLFPSCLPVRPYSFLKSQLKGLLWEGFKKPP